MKCKSSFSVRFQVLFFGLIFIISLILINSIRTGVCRTENADISVLSPDIFVRESQDPDLSVPSDRQDTPLLRGSVMFETAGHLRAAGTGASFANRQCSVICFTMRLYKYDIDTGVSTYLDYHSFYSLNSCHCAGSCQFTVPETGYYFLTGLHSIHNQHQMTQTSVIYIY